MDQGDGSAAVPSDSHLRCAMKNIPNIANTISKVLACLILAIGSLKAQGSINQVLTLQVMELNKIDLAAGLAVNSVDPTDFAQLCATGAKTTLVWTSNGEDKKITVAISGAPRDGLRIIAEEISPAAGVTSAEVRISKNSTRDLIVGVTKSAGKCVIRFTATSIAGQGIGTDTNVITFTITSS